MRPLFADMLAVTSAIECHSLGYDIFTENPCDPVARPYVFGRPFLWMSQLGITTGDALLLGLASALVFLVAVLLVIRPGNLLSSICSLGLVLSPAILLAIERGNSDLVVFVLLVLCLKLLTSPGLIAACVSAGVLLVLSMMKLYPIAALVGVGLYVFAVNREWRPFAVAGITFIIYCLIDIAFLRTITGSIPNVTGHATFGVETLFDRFGMVLGTVTRVTGLAIGIVVAVCAFVYGNFDRLVDMHRMPTDTGFRP